MDEIKQENSEQVHKKKEGNFLRDKPWAVSTFVLGILVILLLAGNIFNITGNAVSSADMGKLALDFASNQLQVSGTLDSVESISGIYQVNMNIDGKSVPLYFTKDGNWVGQGSGLVSIVSGKTSSTSNTNTQTQEIPKSVKPIVELYVFTYCPYGTQAEKGILPVVKLLGDKIDFKIRQIGAMHGEYEKIEAERQLCIEKEYPAKFLDYVLNFASSSEIGACGGNATCVDPKIDALYTKLGISKTKIESCMASYGASLYSTEEQNSKSKGVSGSPTLIINGVKASSARDSASYLDIICQAFSNGSVPAECGEQLSSTAPSPGFGSGTASSGSAAQC